MFNSVNLIGHVGRDPELSVKSGAGENETKISKFSLATSRTFGSGSEKKEQTTWHKVTAFGRLAEICSQHLKKGRLVYVAGRLHYDEFTGKDGGKRTTVEIIAGSMIMLDRPGS